MKLRLPFLLLLFASGFAFAYEPPVGIPMPSFGIKESHTMYLGQKYDYSTGAAPYKDAGNGPYTHYIDNTSSNATDTNNPYGTPALPRLSIPQGAPAGSVIEVHGGPYATPNFNGEKAIGLYAYGTPDTPVFIRGVPGALPTIAKLCFLCGTYTIYENLSFINDGGIKFRADLDPRHGDTDHIALRHLVMHGTGTASGAGGIYGIGSWKTPVYPWTRHVLIWENVISDYGDWKASFENDSGCASTHGFNCSDVWILDNDFSHAGGDAIRIGSNPVAAYPAYTSRRIYVGRNKLHDNRENGLDIKGIADVVVSENEMWGAAPCSSSNGEEIVAHYKCDNIWIVNNRIHDAVSGLAVSDARSLFVIGNEIYDCGNGIKFWSGNQMAIVNNTFARYTNGICDVGSSHPHSLINNIFAGRTGKPIPSEAAGGRGAHKIARSAPARLPRPPQAGRGSRPGRNRPNPERERFDLANGADIKMTTAAANVSEMKNNLIYEADGSFRVVWGSFYTSLSSFQSARGKGQNVLLSDPKFVNSTGNNFRLQATSPAIDRGFPVTEYIRLFASRFPGTSIAVDRAGIPRPRGKSWDIGAHEYAANGPAPTPKPSPSKR